MDMHKLVDYLNLLSYHYYTLDDPLVSDAEYDMLYDQLVVMEKQTGTVLPHAPTQRVGDAVLAGFATHTHRARLWSMDKAQEQAALLAWTARAQKMVEEPLSFVVEYKFDGLAINLTYNDGLLVRATTRGNGIVGEDVSAQVKTIHSIPMKIPFLGLVEISGECIMKRSAFELYNETATEPLKNPRNGAAGALRNLDPRVTASRKLSAFFYHVGYLSDGEFIDHTQMMNFLREQKLPISPYSKICQNMEAVERAIAQVQKDRNKLDFDIDGVVVKVFSFAQRHEMGYTDRFPRWAIAWKFPAQEATTKLLSVSWEVGRTGKLTPLARLEPVELAGARVQRATLNNWGDICRKDVKIGARVLVRRSNDVIPEIMGRVEEEGDFGDIVPPVICPACSSQVSKKGAHIFCTNESCPPKLVAKLAHFASRDAMNIDYFSEKTAELLQSHLGIYDAADLYDLQREQLVVLPGFGEKKADNLLRALEKSKKAALENFIFALGIENIGKKTARDLAHTFGSVDALSDATQEELMSIEEVGEIVAQSILSFFNDEKNQRMLARFVSHGITPRISTRMQGSALKDKIIVVTGTLPTLSRTQAEEMILEQGGKVMGSVSKKTNFVLCGEKAGSKRDKAEALGIPIISQAEFLKMIDEEDCI